jgi:hypothetical protein
MNASLGCPQAGKKKRKTRSPEISQMIGLHKQNSPFSAELLFSWASCWQG